MTLPQRRHPRLNQAGGSVEVFARQRVPDCLGAVTVVLVPVAGTTVQVGHPGWLLIEEARAQHVGKELVVAIPAPAVIKRDEEEVPAIERLQHRRAALVTSNGIAERASQPTQDRGLQQELADMFGLTLQDLVGQV